MADNTDNDRLRVELLRAHWGLGTSARLLGGHARRARRIAVPRPRRGPRRVEPLLSTAHRLNPLEPTDVTALSKDLEAYEKIARSSSSADSWSPSSALSLRRNEAVDRTLADAMEQHYRNANIRVAITAEMLNRMVGKERSELRPIRDRIAGASIRGQSDIHSESRVQLSSCR